MNTIAFFNNKGGVGKTTLVYHLAWIWADAGRRVLMVDLDPQSNLSAMCLSEERLECLWPDTDNDRKTVYGALDPIVQGTGDVAVAHYEELNERLALLVGDIRLSSFEARLSDAWPRAMDRDAAAFRVLSAIYRLIEEAATRWDAQLVLLDVGPNLGALNRAALIASEWVVTPLGSDLFSVQGLRNLGPTLARWREEWTERSDRQPPGGPALPRGSMKPVGYVVMQPNVYAGQVTQAYRKWLAKMPEEYQRAVLDSELPPPSTVDADPRCLGVLKHYRSLMPMAQSARRPLFHLTPADGALGSHLLSARAAGEDFRRLAERIAHAAGVPPPAPCPACGGRGWLVDNDGGVGAARRCDCQSRTGSRTPP